jgi:hypothetical protein
MQVVYVDAQWHWATDSILGAVIGRLGDGKRWQCIMMDDYRVVLVRGGDTMDEAKACMTEAVRQMSEVL